MTLTFDSEEEKMYKAAIIGLTNADKVRVPVAAHPLESAKLIVSLAPLAHPTLQMAHGQPEGCSSPACGDRSWDRTGETALPDEAAEKSGLDIGYSLHYRES